MSKSLRFIIYAYILVIHRILQHFINKKIMSCSQSSCNLNFHSGKDSKGTGRKEETRIADYFTFVSCPFFKELRADDVVVPPLFILSTILGVRLVDRKRVTGQGHWGPRSNLITCILGLVSAGARYRGRQLSQQLPKQGGF